MNELHMEIAISCAMGIIIGGIGGYMSWQSEEAILFISSCNEKYGIGEWNVIVSPENQNHFVCAPISYLTIDNITLPVRT